MTALCGGGSSRPKANTLESVILSSSGICAALHRWGLDRLCQAVVVALSGKQFLASVICSVDPPPDPGLVAQDWIDLLNFTNSGQAAVAGERVAQWFIHNYWQDICECVSVPTPPVSLVLPPQPTGTNPNVPPGAPSSCFSWNGTLSLSAGLPPNGKNDLTQLVLPPIGPLTNVTSGGAVGALTAYATPVGLKSITSTVQLDANDPIDSGAFVIVEYFNAQHTSLRQDTIGQGSVHTPVHLAQFAVPAGAAFWSLYTTDVSGSPAQLDWSTQITADCGGPGFTSDCCPPDPSVDIRLRQITDLVIQLLNRPAEAAGYVKGTAHPGISGTASFNVPSVPGGPSLRGMLVELTAGVPSHIQLPGVPEYQWDMGWMSVLTGDGMIEERRITRQHQLWFATSFPLATTFGYYLFPGVVATFTELLAPA